MNYPDKSTRSRRDNKAAYTVGWTDDAVSMMLRRSGERAAFALNFIRSGSDVLDVGCGPGSITTALADAVGATGSVIGIDFEPSQVELARQDAATIGKPGNVRFVEGDAYELPFESGSFDLVFAHALFEHLSQPKLLLAEFKRVLRPDGVAAICSSDWSAAIIEPRDDDVDRALEAHYVLRRRAGGDPFIGRKLPRILPEAGWSLVETEHLRFEDMPYQELAKYVRSRIVQALETPRGDAELLRAANAAAERWEKRQWGHFSQFWFACVAAPNGSNLSMPGRG